MPKYFISQMQNITRRKMLEDQVLLEKSRLQQERQKFSTIFNSTYQFIGFLEPGGTLIEANETAMNFAGFRPEDVIGKEFWDCHWWLISRETQEQLKTAIERAALGETVNYEVAVWDMDKDPVTILFNLKPLKDQNGNVVYIIPEGTLFQNLIGNGLKYQATGNQPIIEVGCSETEAGYTLSFRDNGIGIAPENHVKVFSLFTRLHKKTAYEGTGMGLATCKKIVSMYNGDIWVESKEGDGSDFKVFFPRTV